MPQLTLVTGPASSGKSAWAEHLAARYPRVTYIATARSDPSDPEWQAKLARHAARRPAHWHTREVPIALGAALGECECDCLLVDSLGTWVANCLERSERDWSALASDLVARLPALPVPAIFVAEETGWGVVPAFPAGRTFRDRLGYLIRQVGARADSVQLVAGGYALDLSRLGTPLPRDRDGDCAD